MSNQNKISRRTLLQSMVIAAPVAVAGCTRPVADTGEPMLRATDPVARSMAYYPDTEDVPADHPLAVNHDVSQKCADCLHRRGSAGPGRIECPTFPGRSVSPDGWCSLWVQG